MGNLITAYPFYASCTRIGGYTWLVFWLNETQECLSTPTLQRRRRCSQASLVLFVVRLFIRLLVCLFPWPINHADYIRVRQSTNQKVYCLYQMQSNPTSYQGPSANRSPVSRIYNSLKKYVSPLQSIHRCVPECTGTNNSLTRQCFPRLKRERERERERERKHNFIKTQFHLVKSVTTYLKVFRKEIS